MNSKVQIIESNFVRFISKKQTGDNKRTGGAEFFHLLHEKKVQGGAKKMLVHDKHVILKQPT